MAILQKCLTWFGAAFSEPNGTPSSKRILFAFVVVSTISFCGGAYKKEGMTGQIVDLLKTALYVTGGAYVGGRFAESNKTQEAP